MKKTTCPYCGSSHVIRRGNWPKSRMECKDKKHPDGVSRFFYREYANKDILVVDIETLPGIKRFWRLGEQDWNLESIVHDWMLLSFAAKWLYEPKHM